MSKPTAAQQKANDAARLEKHARALIAKEDAEATQKAYMEKVKARADEIRGGG